MVFAVGLLGFLIVAICCYCFCYRKCCKKKKKEEKKAAKEKVDLKAVQMLAASYQEKVQPSVDELDYNSDEFQSDGSSGVKIGIDKNVMSNFVVSLNSHTARPLHGWDDPGGVGNRPKFGYR